MEACLAVRNKRVARVPHGAPLSTVQVLSKAQVAVRRLVVGLPSLDNTAGRQPAQLRPPRVGVPLKDVALPARYLEA